MGEFDGRVVVIAGSASFIGEAIATDLVAAGASVVLGDRDADHGAAVAARLGSAARFVQSDVSQDADLDRLIATADESARPARWRRRRRCDFDDELLASTRELWDRVLDVNVTSAAMLTTKAAAVMAAGGAIVHVASVSGHVSQPAHVVYNVSKAALLMLVKSSAHHLAPRRIRVNAVSPGWTWSRNIERRYGTRERADALAAEFQPLGRMADPEEVAHAVDVPAVGPRVVRHRRRAARRWRLFDDRSRGARSALREGPDDRLARRQRRDRSRTSSSSVARLDAM